MLRRGALAVVVVGGVALAFPAAAQAGAPPQALPPLTAAPSPVAPGAELSVSGGGCQDVDGLPSQALVAFDGTAVGTADPDADGAWSLSFRVPASTASGDHTVSATCDTYAGTADYPDLTVSVAADGTGTGGAPGTGAPTLTCTGCAAVAPGGRVTLTGSRFTPSSQGTAVLRSTPTTLGAFRTDATGGVVVSYVIPAGVPSGAHTLTLTDGGGRSAVVPVTVVAGTSRVNLASTGSSVAAPLALGGVSLLAGTGLLLVARRRRPAAHRA